MLSPSQSYGPLKSAICLLLFLMAPVGAVANCRFDLSTQEFTFLEIVKRSLKAQKTDILAKMQSSAAEIEDNPASPDFENTIAALDETFSLPDPLEFLMHTLANEAITRRELTGFSYQREFISFQVRLRSRLFKRVQFVYQHRSNMQLDAEQIRLTDLLYQWFLNSGANLGDDEKAQLIETKRRLTELAIQYDQNLVEERAFLNRDLIPETLALRRKLAQLLGHESYASYHLSSELVGDPKAAEQMMEQAQRFYLHWHKKTPSVLTNGLEEYLELENVIEGILRVFHKMFRLTFKARPDLNTWHKLVKAYEVFDEDSNSLGFIYLDLYKRDKYIGRGLAGYAFSYRSLSEGRSVTTSLISMTLPNPQENQPTLLNPWDVQFLSHEFGHALHTLLCKSRYKLLAKWEMMSLEYVEAIGLLFERIALNPEVISEYAIHFRSGNSLPPKLLLAMQAAPVRSADQNFYLAMNSLLDLHMHNRQGEKIQAPENLIAFEANLKSPVAQRIGWGPLTLRADSSQLTFATSGGAYDVKTYVYLRGQMLADGIYRELTKEPLLTGSAGRRLARDLFADGWTAYKNIDALHAYTNQPVSNQLFFESEEARLKQILTWRRSQWIGLLKSLFLRKLTE